MADCAACGTRLEDGITRCPQCGASLEKPGVALQAVGWVVMAMALIPLAVGVVAMAQKNYIVLGVGIATLIAGLVMVFIGGARTRAAPDTTRPSPAPGVQPPGGLPPRDARI